MDRRDLIRSGASLLALGALGCSSEPDAASATAELAPLPDVDDEGDTSLFQELAELAGERVPGMGGEIDQSRGEIFTGSTDGALWQAPPLSPDLETMVHNSRYWSVTESARPQPQWAQNSRASDYHHLSDFAAPASETFELNGAALAFLAERNHFSFTDRRPVRIFGLRGAALENDAEEAQWGPTHRLKAQSPGHIACRCLLGVWRPADGQIALFRASTTPSVSNMFKSLRTRGGGTSLLPTGLYNYRAGPHKRAYPDRIQRGSLLIEGQYVVLRTPDDLSYDPFQPNDIWTRGAAHNIHSAGEWSRPQVYDSAGCQVVRGKYNEDRTRALGAWAGFRRAAGLVDAAGASIAEEAAGSGTYQYMLLTGLEASLYASGDQSLRDNYRRLRFGSRGDAVAAHKERLRTLYPDAPVSTNNRFDMWTSFVTLMNRKQVEGEYIAPIVSV
jgi:hypothetical protein